MKRVKDPRQIIDRRVLLQELHEQVALSGYSPKTRDLFLQIFKAALYRGIGEIRRRFEEERIDGTEVVHSDSCLVDHLVRTLFDFACTHAFPQAGGADIAVVATGGYGRDELSPFSDIDLMFLIPDSSKPSRADVIEFALYMLWDMGLKVGHATRTVDDCVKLAREDLTIRTSLLEARWLWGNQELYARFEKRFESDVIAGTGTAFVESKLAERDARHARMGDSRYVLEPHIKEGKGGLRDLQTLFWIAKYLYRVKDMDELVDRGVFTPVDARHFRQTQDFLWTVRCQLHYVTGRPEERLTFDVQGIIADRLGYRDRPGASGVERFMKHYFLMTKAVGDLTRVLCAVLEEDHRKSRKRLRLPSLASLRRVPAGFRMDGNRLTVTGQDVFAEDPVRMLRLFREAQRLEVDIQPHALRLVRQNLRLIDAGVRADPEANSLFMAMLTDGKGSEVTLRRLNEAGVFGRFIPEFGRVVAQMQYDMYHVHTVDEHTIQAIGILQRIEAGELAERHPTASRIIGDIRSRRALYLATLLHDVGKGRGGDHSEIGADMAEHLAPRLGLDAWEAEAVVWLVRYHLLMSRTAFKRDVDNGKTVTDFVELVQSPERLRMLLVLTGADIDAVGPGIWNAWKEGLLSELYYRAMEEIEMTGGQPSERRSQRVAKAKARLQEKLSDWDEALLETFMTRGYSDYWLAFDAESQAYHFRLMRQAEAEGQRLRIEARALPNRDVTELTVYAPDHPGLFARMAGAMALSGANIVGAKITTLANSMALDTFHIQDSDGAAFDQPERLERLRARLEKAVSGQIYPGRELAAVRSAAPPSRTGVFTVPPAVILDNKASATHTVIEVNGRDRQGFLYDVTSTITELGLQIFSAHISTYGERVVDVFYVKDVFGLKIEDRAKLRRIERRLLKAVAPPTEKGRDKPEVAAAE
ncbi:MAG: [protein-PII] uridylyltransferase [Rhodospirillales bacterium]|nr:MAG: [protein-PII] uridylyltransferase [Rhodospirillales bacterium]